MCLIRAKPTQYKNKNSYQLNWQESTKMRTTACRNYRLRSSLSRQSAKLTFITRRTDILLVLAPLQRKILRTGSKVYARKKNCSILIVSRTRSALSIRTQLKITLKTKTKPIIWSYGQMIINQASIFLRKILSQDCSLKRTLHRNRKHVRASSKKRTLWRKCSSKISVTCAAIQLTRLLRPNRPIKPQNHSLLCKCSDHVNLLKLFKFREKIPT